MSMKIGRGKGIRHDWDHPEAAKRRCIDCGVMQRPNPNGKRRHGKGTQQVSRDGGATWTGSTVVGPCLPR